MYNPFSKGRWYRFFIESNGNANILVESDIDGTVIDNNFLILPSRYKILSVVPNINFDISSSTIDTLSYMVINKGRMAFKLPLKNSIYNMELYIFAEKY